MWMVLNMSRNLDITINGSMVKYPCSWADGMVGALPVFEDKKDAETYADGKADVMKIKEIPR